MVIEESICQKDLILKFDLRTIEHLGIQMYKTLPPVLAELISNSYDADATWVNIEFIENNGSKQIIVTDDGHGMSFEEINESFLVIGKNRRKDNKYSGDTSPKGRKVTGRKGLGKLAIFGIANEIQIETIKNNIKNIFNMNLGDILNSQTGVYYPQKICENESVNQNPGTKIILKDIKRKNAFNLEEIRASIAKRFAFDDSNFYIQLNEVDKAPLVIDSNTKWGYINHQFVWEFPECDSSRDNFAINNNIKGRILTTKNPLQEDQRGIFLYARGKLVNPNEFYGLKATSSLAYNYMTGVFNIDYIDEQDIDLITTNRDGLIWEREELQPLKNWLKEQIQNIEKQWSLKRKELKEEKITEITGYSPSEWVNTLPARKRKLASKWLDNIYNEKSIDEDKASNLINHLQLCFKFDTFDDLAADLDNSGLDEVKVLELFKEWRIVESQEFYNLSKGRIKTIEKLQQFINEDAREVPTIHNFIKEFPWLLDPRMTIIKKDEVYFSTLLKEQFPDQKLEEQNRRLDFLCVGFNDTFYVVELKRPSCKVSKEELDQLLEYCEFVREKFGTSDTSYSQVSGYIIAGGHTSIRGVDTRLKQMQSDRMYLKTYPELLSLAIAYHRDFMEKHKEFKE